MKVNRCGSDRRGVLRQQVERGLQAISGKMQRYLGPGPGLAVDRQRPTMQLNQGFDERQAEAGAAVLAGEAVVHLPEGREGGGNIFPPHADTRIADREGEPAALVDGRADLDLAALRGELDGVREEIDQHLLD